MKTALLSLHSLTKVFGKDSPVMVLKDISIEFYQPKSYVITGASGAGKSTLLHIIAGIEHPTSGSVLCNHRDVATLSAKSKELFFNQTIGLIFQLPYLINELTVLENVMLKGIIAKAPYDECKEKAYILLQKLGLEDKASSFPQLLSGGQQQRIAVARALLNRPAFLLADEPTGNLDRKTSSELIDLLLYYQQEYGMGLIISSHDTSLVNKMETVLTVKDGNLLHDIKELRHVQECNTLQQ